MLALLARTGHLLWATWPRRAAVLVAALLTVLIGARLVAGREVPAYQVESRAIVQRVVATGRVRPPARVSLASLALGRVRQVLVREGDAVVAGQVLVTLEDAEPSAALRQAGGRVSEAAARLAQVRGVSGPQAAEALQQAELEVAQAERNAERSHALAAAGATSAQDEDEAVRALGVARSRREAAAAQAASAAGGPETRQAAAALAQAEAARAAAQARLGESEVRAPAAGLVVARLCEPGDVVAAGKPLLSLTLEGPAELTAQVDEKNLALLAVGQPAQASSDAFPGQVFDARVAFLAPSVDPARGTVEVRLTVPTPPPVLLADMTVAINVDVGRKAAALVLPTEAVRDPAGEPWVLVVADGAAARRPVRLGLRGDGLVEVAAGLAAGELVVAPSAGQVAPGTRVRALVRPAARADRAL
ncbi:MAG: efflux RND transporter periplasmic adaptor subunit [Anaeromyxobacter sp.]|nr:efflux RND transporter periplasmic adaptor subunit [Anaeromyxobacter sp.]